MKKLLTLFLTAALALSLAACGESGRNSSSAALDGGRATPLPEETQSEAAPSEEEPASPEQNAAQPAPEARLSPTRIWPSSRPLSMTTIPMWWLRMWASSPF